METSLTSCALFKTLQEDEIVTLLNKYPNYFKTFKKDENVFIQDEICDRLLILVEGIIQTQMVDSMGKLIVIDELANSQLLAPAFLFSEDNRFPVSGLVLEETKILYFDQKIVLRMLQENDILLVNFLRLVSNRSNFLSKKLKFHALMPLRNKLCLFLKEESVKQHSLHLVLNQTQQELANKFGVARPSLARMFAELEKEEIIEMDKKEIFIKNPNALKQLLS